jgi:hypothetical protein
LHAFGELATDSRLARSWHAHKIDVGLRAHA